MATGNAVWGIDVGQCSLKALRCVRNEEGVLEADAFDYIEYPKLLSQPEADPDELIRDALKQFLSRNDVKDCKVAISVSGQSGLARFIKLPPVEEKKIPDIVKFEARQQIPFDLDDVIWDYKVLPGSEGAGITTEVGLFAMKRDQVFRSIRPFEDVGIDLDCVQLVPLGLYNYAVFDQLGNLASEEEYDPDDPPESVVLLSVGTETTDLVVTNGYKVWQRNIPLGGNNFTKQLTRELKLTFAKAEHLKRNARKAEDPKTIFQAMRPEFNALATEVQRSLGYHNTIERNAKIGRILAIGNATKLPGLCQYLEKKLGMKTESGEAVHVTQIDSFPELDDSSINSTPAYAENRPSFAVCYGLCLQVLGEAKLTTNLLPPEILTNRLVQRKKPWALAIAATLLVALTVNLGLAARAWRSVHPDNYKSALDQVERVQSQASKAKSTHEEEKQQAQYLDSLGNAVAGNAERRLLLKELMSALNQNLPKPAMDDRIPSNKEFPIAKRPELYIEYLEMEYYTDTASWYNDTVQRKHAELAGSRSRQPADEDSDEESPSGPSGPGWIVEISGYHYFKGQTATQTGEDYLREALLNKLLSGTAYLPEGTNEPDGTKAKKVRIKLSDLGVTYPVLATANRPEIIEIDNPDYKGGSSEDSPEEPDDTAPAEEETSVPRKLSVEKYSFKIQFCWQEKTASQRRAERLAREEEQRQRREEQKAQDEETD